MKQFIWITDEVVFSIHNMLLAEHGGATGIREIDLLYSALSRPKNKYEYEPSVSIFQLAAAYSFGLARNHPFVDGNKRVALVVGATFLEVNGFTLNASEAEAVLVFEKLASGDLDENNLANWYESFSSSV